MEMRGNHWTTWERYLTAEDSGRARGRKCWKAWGDVLPFESIGEMMSQESKCWKAWERFLPAVGHEPGMSSNPLDITSVPEKVST